MRTKLTGGDAAVLSLNVQRIERAVAELKEADLAGDAGAASLFLARIAMRVRVAQAELEQAHPIEP